MWLCCQMTVYIFYVYKLLLNLRIIFLEGELFMHKACVCKGKVWLILMVNGNLLPRTCMREKGVM